MRRPIRVFTAFLALSLAAGLALATAGPSTASEEGSSRVTERDVSDEVLAEELFRVLKSKSEPALEALLHDSVLLQRSDGTYFTKDEYLENPSTVESYKIDEAFATRSDDIRVLRYTAATEQTINGRKVTNEPVPRLSTYVYTGEQWQLIAQANFTPLPKS